MVISALDEQVFPLDDIPEMIGDAVYVAQIAHTNGLFHIFVRIDGRDSPAGRAEFFIGESVLFEAVLYPVIWHADSCAVADFQVFRGYLYPLFAQPADLADEVLDINNHSRAHDVHCAVAQNAGREQIENKRALFVDDGVTRIVSALIARNYIKILRKIIDDASLAFVAPVDTDYR